LFDSQLQIKNMLTYIFTISFFAVFGMVFLKVYENQKRRRTFISQVLSRFDVSILSNINKGYDILDKNKVKGRALVEEDLPRQVRYVIFVIKKAMREKYDTFLPNMRGNLILKKDGDVSSFLKDIAKHQKEGSGGRIEEENIEIK